MNRHKAHGDLLPGPRKKQHHAALAIGGSTNGGGGPGAGPVAFKNHLEPFAPSPVIVKAESGYRLDEQRPHSVGRLRSFNGQFGMIVRAYTYIRELGAEGLKSVSDLAVLNANYLAALLHDHYPLAYDRTCMHEAVFTDSELEKQTGIKTLDVAKRLIDYGFHPPTVYFPLVVKGAMMIEPTETESKETIEAFADAMIRIKEEAQNEPDSSKPPPTIQGSAAWTSPRRPQTSPTLAPQDCSIERQFQGASNVTSRNND